MKFTLLLLPLLIATACASDISDSDLGVSPPRTPAKLWRIRVETDDGLCVTRETDGSVKIIQTKHFCRIGQITLKIGEGIPMREDMDFGYLNPLMKNLPEDEFFETIEKYSSIREISHTAAKL